MIRFFPRHKLSSEELSLIPEALFYLILARIKVSFIPSRFWMPKKVEGVRCQASGDGAKGDEDDGATKELRDEDGKQAQSSGHGAQGVEQTCPPKPWRGRRAHLSSGALAKEEGAECFRVSEFQDFRERVAESRLQNPSTRNPEPGTLNNYFKTAKLIASLINGLAARTPWKSTCLVKALAVHKMLKRRNIESQIHFGVKKASSVGFEAHAWLSVYGEVVIGGENLDEFVELG